MSVEDDTPHHTTYEGERHYFCSADCKEAFEQSPRKYAGGGGSHEVH